MFLLIVILCCLCGLFLLILLVVGLVGFVYVLVVDLLDLEYCLLVSKQQVNLQQCYYGQVLLVVNIVSKCGYIFQYEGLEVLQKCYVGRGFVVFGFLFNDFKGQEFGDEKQIQDFCMFIYGVRFLMFEKVYVVGVQVMLLYQRLIVVIGVVLGWNFYKYLVGCDGKVIVQFVSKVMLDDLQLIVVIDKVLVVVVMY